MSTDKLIKTTTDSQIADQIYVIRDLRVMLDKDLPEMFRVPTSRLNEAVKRNITRFPEDFMFRLNSGEFKGLISQTATSKGRGAPANCPLHSRNRLLP